MTNALALLKAHLEDYPLAIMSKANTQRVIDELTALCADLAAANDMKRRMTDACEEANKVAEQYRAELAAAKERYAELVLVFDRINTQRVTVISIAREGFEIIAGKRQCLDNLMGNTDVAEDALARIDAALKGGK